MMIADGAHAAGGKLYILGGQWDRLTVANFPAQHPSMAVVLIVRVEYSEALDSHKLEADLTLDGESKGARADVHFTTGHTPAQRRGSPSFVPLPLPFNNLVFEKPGCYEWVIRVDEAELGRVPIEVVQGSVA